MYCLSHKKGAMVLVSEDLVDPPHVEAEKTSVAPTAVDSKKMKARPPPTTADHKETKKARRTKKAEQESGTRADGRAGEQRVKSAGGGGKTAGKTAVKRSVKVPAEGGPRSRADALSSSPAAATTSATSGKEQEDTAAAAASAVQARPTPPPASTNRLADTSGMSPSVEFLVLRQAREAAKKEAEASGGRRPRAPSRRALEASGRMKDEGAQWMSREKKAEQARAMKELREQRRQYRAAGLGVGVVVEAYVANEMAAATATGNGAVAGGGRGGGGAEALPAAQEEPGWRKVSPALLAALPPRLSKEKGEVAPAAGEMRGKLAGPTAAANSA